MVVVHGGHAQQHEDDGLAAGGEHLHRVLDGGVRLGRHVRDHVVLHCKTTERYSAINGTRC